MILPYLSPFLYFHSSVYVFTQYMGYQTRADDNSARHKYDNHEQVIIMIFGTVDGQLSYPGIRKYSSLLCNAAVLPVILFFISSLPFW